MGCLKSSRFLISKTITLLICLGILKYQLFTLTTEYLQYRTVVNIQMKPQSEVQDFPALSVCSRMPALSRGLIERAFKGDSRSCKPDKTGEKGGFDAEICRQFAENSWPLKKWFELDSGYLKSVEYPNNIEPKCRRPLQLKNNQYECLILYSALDPDCRTERQTGRLPNTNFDTASRFVKLSSVLLGNFTKSVDSYTIADTLAQYRREEAERDYANSHGNGIYGNGLPNYIGIYGNGNDSNANVSDGNHGDGFENSFGNYGNGLNPNFEEMMPQNAGRNKTKITTFRISNPSFEGQILQFQLPWENHYEGEPVAAWIPMFVELHLPKALPGLVRESESLSYARNTLQSDRLYQLVFTWDRIERLEPPYDTRCRSYRDDETQSFCLWRCGREHHFEKCDEIDLNRAPAIKALDGDRYVAKDGCGRNLWFETDVSEECERQCLAACSEMVISYELVDVTEKVATAELTLWRGLAHSVVELTAKLQNEITYYYLAQISFVDFLGNLGGLFGLWLGLSIMSVYDGFAAVGKWLAKKVKGNKKTFKPGTPSVGLNFELEKKFKELKKREKGSNRLSQQQLSQMVNGFVAQLYRMQMRM